jgi:hypothetical protein
MAALCRRQQPELNLSILPEESVPGYDISELRFFTALTVGFKSGFPCGVFPWLHKLAVEPSSAPFSWLCQFKLYLA